ncbi:MAG: cell filamentation protein Fic [Saprospirales bacterium]|nr:cell filamentation protein Fic [Saprospirales bacterium]
MAFQPDIPYNDLPLLPPDKANWETLAVYKNLAEARAAMAELKGRMPIIPNPLMLINTLVLQEAKESSSIENIFTSSDKLYKAFASSTMDADPQTKEVLRYRVALYEGWQQQQNNGIDLSLIENVYRKIKDKNDGIRDSEVYLGNRYKVVYTPPCCYEILNEKLKNWVEFAKANDDIDPLIKMAILHYQFEAIHPFTDGNGRTGRVLNVLYLTQAGLIDKPVLYLSKFINAFKADYYRLLLGVTESSDWEAWVIYMLKAVKATAEETLKKLNQIFELLHNTIEKVRTEAGDIYSRELVDMLFVQPYCKISFLVNGGIASRNTASKYLNRLVDLGILELEKVGNESLYLNRQLYDLLSE